MSLGKADVKHDSAVLQVEHRFGAGTDTPGRDDLSVRAPAAVAVAGISQIGLGDALAAARGVRGAPRAWRDTVTAY